mmetsp:Transcript_31915/g.5780  ORF Transcript_31915/g.5780 Transcript_31915/m.5780 type:complete len:80 (+) Transcript_31915:1660-1899(+)
MSVRSTAVGLATATNWVSNFVVTMTFLTISETYFGQVFIWGLFGLILLFGWLFIFILLPETKGYNLERILLLFKYSPSS